jgi:RNA recognition motif-containing protein
VLDCEIIRDKHGKSKGYCFATYASRAALLQSVGKSHVLKGKVFEIREQLDSDKNSELLNEIAKRKLFISNLRSSIDENDLEKFFVKFGPIEEVLISRDPATQQSKGFGFVKFREGNSVREALIGQEKRTLKIKNHEVTIKECIPKSQMSRMKKHQKQEESPVYYSTPSIENCNDPFAIYNSPLMSPQMPYTGILGSHNYNMSQAYDIPIPHPVFDSQVSQIPMNIMEQFSPQKQTFENSKTKMLNVNSFSFSAEYQPESVTSQVVSPAKGCSMKPVDRTPKTIDFSTPEGDLDVEPFSFNISDEPLPTPRKLGKEECLKMLAMMQADTAPNSLAGSFSSQATATSELNPQQNSQVILEDCKCDQRNSDLSKRPSNLFENLKDCSCPFGKFSFDENLINTGLISKPWKMTSKSLIFNNHESRFPPEQSTRPFPGQYDSLHGFSLNSDKYKLLSERHADTAGESKTH